MQITHLVRAEADGARVGLHTQIVANLRHLLRVRLARAAPRTVPVIDTVPILVIRA